MGTVGRRKQFCLRGHDTYKTGRYSTGKCRECSYWSQRERNGAKEVRRPQQLSLFEQPYSTSHEADDEYPPPLGPQDFSHITSDGVRHATVDYVYRQLGLDDIEAAYEDATGNPVDLSYEHRGVWVMSADVHDDPDEREYWLEADMLASTSQRHTVTKQRNRDRKRRE
jgi:hypothetical protein